jgi:hypothetical protein
MFLVPSPDSIFASRYITKYLLDRQDRASIMSTQHQILLNPLHIANLDGCGTGPVIHDSEYIYGAGLNKQFKIKGPQGVLCS